MRGANYLDVLRLNNSQKFFVKTIDIWGKVWYNIITIKVMTNHQRKENTYVYHN